MSTVPVSTAIPTVPAFSITGCQVSATFPISQPRTAIAPANRIAPAATSPRTTTPNPTFFARSFIFIESPLVPVLSVSADCVIVSNAVCVSDRLPAPRVNPLNFPIAVAKPPTTSSPPIASVTQFTSSQFPVLQALIMSFTSSTTVTIPWNVNPAPTSAQFLEARPIPIARLETPIAA